MGTQKKQSKKSFQMKKIRLGVNRNGIPIHPKMLIFVYRKVKSLLENTKTKIKPIFLRESYVKGFQKKVVQEKLTYFDGKGLITEQFVASKFHRFDCPRLCCCLCFHYAWCRRLINIHHHIQGCTLPQKKTSLLPFRGSRCSKNENSPQSLLLAPGFPFTPVYGTYIIS